MKSRHTHKEAASQPACEKEEEKGRSVRKAAESHYKIMNKLKALV